MSEEEARIQGICIICEKNSLDCTLVWTSKLFLSVYCPNCAPHKHADVWADLRAHLTQRLQRYAQDDALAPSERKEEG